jgi:hypothetical protein
MEAKIRIPEEDLQKLHGTYFDIDDTWTIYGNDPVHVVTPEKKTLFKLMKQVIPIDMCDLAVECYLSAGKMVSTNRGYAAGALKRGHKYRFDQGNVAHSGIIGFIDSPNSQHPCRMTRFGRLHFEKYQRGLPFIRCIDRCFKTAAPTEYHLQINAAQSTDFKIHDTAFSTVTVNYNFRTALHKDSGDFQQGLGNLVVCQHNVSGGLLLFPKYKIAVRLSTGDFLAMDVHEWHCNSPIEKTDSDGYRLSFVCYFRERMLQCKDINRTIDMLDGISTSADIINTMFRHVGDTLPEKQPLGEGKNGEAWWVLENSRFCIIYRHRRYTFFDKERQKKIQNLLPALRYVIENYDV